MLKCQNALLFHATRLVRQLGLKAFSVLFLFKTILISITMYLYFQTPQDFAKFLTLCQLCQTLSVSVRLCQSLSDSVSLCQTLGDHAKFSKVLADPDRLNMTFQTATCIIQNGSPGLKLSHLFSFVFVLYIFYMCIKSIGTVLL